MGDAKNTNGQPYFRPREFWAAALHVLRVFAASEYSRTSLEPGDGLAPHVVMELALLIEDLLAGTIPDQIRPLLHQGAPTTGTVDRRARAMAQAYVQFAHQGLIPDPAPVSTICVEFGIKARTASEWLRKPVLGYPWVPSKRHYSEKVRAEMVDSTLWFAAREYRRRGRSQSNRTANQDDWFSRYATASLGARVRRVGEAQVIREQREALARRATEAASKPRGSVPDASNPESSPLLQKPVAATNVHDHRDNSHGGSHGSRTSRKRR